MSIGMLRKGFDMAQRTTRSPSLMEVAVRNAGIIKGSTAITWIWCWGVAKAALGHTPTVEEVAEWWNASARSCYRDQSAFRRAFPGYEDPEKLTEIPAVKAVIEETAVKMTALGEKLASRRRPTDMAATRIGFLPLGT